MSIPASPAMLESVAPTEAELNVIKALREAANRGLMFVIDPDSMTGWPCGRPQYFNGKRRESSAAALPFALEFPT